MNRSLQFRNKSHHRHWWYWLPTAVYEPSLYSMLTDEEWAIMADWYETTEKNGTVGEIGVPAMNFIQGLVMGNGIRHIVQLGHFYGYSTLLLGFMLRHMNLRPGLVSIDIDVNATMHTQEWVEQAGLSDFVQLLVIHSTDEDAYRYVSWLLGGAPELVVVDSSHAYAHTLAELDLWALNLPMGGIMVLHDTSEFSVEYDPTHKGGVKRALDEWTPAHPEFGCINLNRQARAGEDLSKLAYKDACGLSILQRQG